MSALEAYEKLQKAQSQQLGKECCCFNKLLEPEICMNATSNFKQPCSVCVEIFTVFCAAICFYMFFIYTFSFSAMGVQCPSLLVRSREEHKFIILGLPLCNWEDLETCA